MKMYEFNYSDKTFLKKTCRACLRISDDVRAMSTAEENAYLKVVEQSYVTSELLICLYCAHIVKKFNKFFIQCHQAHCIIESFLEKKDTKPQVFSPLLSSHNLIVSHQQVIDIPAETEDYNVTVFEDAPFDDEDVPLVMLKKEECEEIKVKKKKKKKGKKRSFNAEESQHFPQVKTEVVSEEGLLLEQQSSYEEVKKTKKPKKELRDGFSSRMVQETEEYTVIKLTKEQVLEELSARSKTEEYQRSLFKCHHCVKGFNFEDVLRSHMEKHSPEHGSFRCEICTQYCPSAVSLRGHMKSHTTRYRCKVCGCERQARQHLLEHHATHTRAPQTYSCRQCEFTTTKRTSMQRHVKSHRPTERHACHQCGKLFKSLETLRVHTMRHDKSASPQCPSCGRGFIYPSLLHRHIQAVHVRKDYYCCECGTEFKSRENLRLHFKKAKKHRDASSYQHECPQCSERFISASTLSTHMTTHTQEKKHSCAACLRLYSSRDALRAHVRAKHRDGARAGNLKTQPLTHSRLHESETEHKKIEDGAMLVGVTQPTLLPN